MLLFYLYGIFFFFLNRSNGNIILIWYCNLPPCYRNRISLHLLYHLHPEAMLYNFIQLLGNCCIRFLQGVVGLILIIICEVAPIGRQSLPPRGETQMEKHPCPTQDTNQGSTIRESGTLTTAPNGGYYIWFYFFRK